MIGKTRNQNQRDFFKPLLKEFINLEHELVLLSDKIDWRSLANLYSHTGQPAIPIRLMVGSLILNGFTI